MSRTGFKKAPSWAAECPEAPSCESTSFPPP